MSQITDGIWWLFNTKPGVGCLIGFGIVLFIILAFVLEKRTAKLYYNHEVPEEDRSIFDSDEIDEALAQEIAEKSAKKAAKNKKHTY